jgi:hypothetical protein
MKPAFFHTIDGDPRALQPQPHAKGAWNPMLVFGRLLGGLLARTIDLDGAGPDFTCTRLTIDLFRSAPLGPPITCRAATIRQGRRIRVVLATVELDGEPIAQATAVLLRRGEQPHQDHLVTPRWQQVPPAPHDQVSPPSATWDSWLAHDGASQGAAGMLGGLWVRESHHLVDQEPVHRPPTRRRVDRARADRAHQRGWRGCRRMPAARRRGPLRVRRHH